jgi:Tol biopolymer transport system component
MLAKQRDQRYQSASEALRDLAGISGAKSVPKYWPAALGLAIIAAIALFWLYFPRPGERPQEVITSDTVLVAWPGTETGARIATDGKWFSFMSSRDGGRSLYIGRLGEGEPERIESLSGIPWSHAWSPGSDELACVIQQGDDYFLQVIPAARRGTPKRTFEFSVFRWDAASDLTAVRPTVVDWLGSHLYISGQLHLWNVDRNTGALEKVTALPVRDRLNISVRSDEQRIVFDDNSRIWVADLDGRNATCLTADSSREFNPEWVRRDNEWHLVFASNRSGHIGLWEYSLASKSYVPLVLGGMDRKTLEASTRDGSLMIYRVMSEPASLWCWDPATAASHQLAGETLGEYAPTVAPRSNVLAYEKTRKLLDEGSSQVDTEIWLGELRLPRTEQTRRVVDYGFSPRLSPDGNRLSYMQYDRNKKSFSLRLRDLSSQVDKLISDRALIEDQYSNPRGWGPENPIWSADGDRLLFLERAGLGASTLNAFSVSANHSALWVASRSKELIADPRISIDGNVLMYSIWSEELGVRHWEIRQRSTSGGDERTIFSETGPFRLHNLGWLGKSVLAARQYFPAQSGLNTGPLEILRREPDGVWHTIGRFDLAYGYTAALDADRGVLYLTVIENGLSNVRAFYPSSGKSSRITDNQRREMTFAGLQVCGAGRLLYSHHGLISDLYLLERRR